MPKILKVVAIAVGALFALLVVGIGILAVTFDPNDYKPQLIRLVQEKKQRTLTIPGDITLSLFPKLGADLGKVSISERNSNDEFAAISSAKLSLALIPLLSKRFVVDQIHIDGLRANIRRQKDGSSNFDDFVAKEGQPEESAQEVSFDIERIDINNAYVLYDDQQTGRKLELVKLNLQTGKVASGVPGKMDFRTLLRSNMPDINASIHLKGGFLFDLDAKRYVLKDAEGEVRGNLPGISDAVLKLTGNADVMPGTRHLALDGIKVSLAGKSGAQTVDARFALPQLRMTENTLSGARITADAKLTAGTRIVNAALAAPAFSGTPQALRLPAVALDASVRDVSLDAKAKLSGDVAGDIGRMQFTSPQLTLALTGKQGDAALNGSLTTTLRADLKASRIELGNIAANFSLPHPGGGILSLAAKGQASVEPGRQRAETQLKGSFDGSGFDAKLGINGFSPLAYRFDLGIDRLDLDRYRSKPTATAKPKSGPQAAQPIDFAALKNLNAAGNVRIGALKAANIRVSNLRATLNASGGRLDLEPMSANLYGGKLGGSLALVAGTPARIAAKQSLSGVQVGPLLKDALQKEAQVEGAGNVQLDLGTSGTTVAQFKKALNGSARIALRDGSVKGINIAQTLRNVQSRLGGGGTQSGAAAAHEKTDFSELNGSFRIVNGVARNDDLSLKSPLLRVAGEGDINIGEDRLDYLVKASVVSSLKGQGGPELQALRGITVPVKLDGPFNAISWHIDVAGMAGALAKQKLEERKDALKSKAQEQIQEGLGKGLKGLFGR